MGGGSAHDMGGPMGNGSSQPAATEYTLQGMCLPVVANDTVGPGAVASLAER